MDAYDLIEMLKKLWQDKADKASGLLQKRYSKMEVVVHTDEGLRNVVGVRWDDSTKKIMLLLDTE